MKKNVGLMYTNDQKDWIEEVVSGNRRLYVYLKLEEWEPKTKDMSEYKQSSGMDIVKIDSE